MVMTGIEIIASIVAIFSLIKLGVIAYDKKLWMQEVSRYFYGSKTFATLASLIIIGLCSYVLLQTFTLVELFAVLGLVMGLFAFAFAQYNDEVIDLGKKMLRRKLSVPIIIYSILWALLSIWVLKIIFW